MSLWIELSTVSDSTVIGRRASRRPVCSEAQPEVILAKDAERVVEDRAVMLPHRRRLGW